MPDLCLYPGEAFPRDLKLRYTCQPVSGGTNYIRNVTDSAPAIDVVSRMTNQARSSVDIASAVDAVMRSGAFARSPIDSAPAIDAVTRATTRTRGLTESAPATDAVNRVIAAMRAISDTAPAQDSASRSIETLRALADEAAITELINRSGSFSRPTSDEAPATDSAARSGGTARQIQDQAPATDSTQRAVTRNRFLTDSAPAMDSATAILLNILRDIDFRAELVDTKLFALAENWAMGVVLAAWMMAQPVTDIQTETEPQWPAGPPQVQVDAFILQATEWFVTQSAWICEVVETGWAAGEPFSDIAASLVQGWIFANPIIDELALVR